MYLSVHRDKDIAKFLDSRMSLDLDRSYVGPYLKDWLEYVRECNETELQAIASDKEFRVPYAGVPLEMIRAIFVICGRFNTEPHARYMAVHLLDRYMGYFFRDLLANVEDLSETVKQQVREKMASQAKLVLASCVQIASKVDLYKTLISVSQIQDLLLSIDPGRTYSISTISSSEIRILKALDFRIPICLPIHVVEIFLAYVELTYVPHMRETCIHLLDVAYLRHDAIFEHLHLMARGSRYEKSSQESRDFLRLEADAAFLAAAVVVCSNFFLQLKRDIVDSLTSKLANLIEMGAIDIHIMANIIFTFALDEEDFKGLQEQLPPSDDD